MRLSQTWEVMPRGERTAGAPFCDGVIVLEGTVHYRASNLEHQMRAAWRPAHLLLGVHPAVHQPCTVLSVTAVEIGSSRRLAVA